LQLLGANRLGSLVRPVDRLLDLGDDLLSIRAKRLWSLFNTLRIKHEGHVEAKKNDNWDDRDERRLDDLVAGLLKDAVETYNIFAIGDAMLVALDAARPGPQEIGIAKTENATVASVLVKAGANRAITQADAAGTIREQSDNITEASDSVPGRHAADFGRKTIRNFIGALLHGAYSAVRAELALSWKGMREGAYREIGKVVLTDLAGPTLQMLKLIADNAEALIKYAGSAFHNPQVVHIIELIKSLF
jgi:hypothetical protein